MKRLICVFLAAVWFLGTSGPSYAEEKDSMTDKGMKEGHGRMGQCMMMKKMMMGKEMVASADGGVIVLVGNKIMKYDKDLNLVKEVEIDMKAMMEKCREMMKGHDMKEGSE